MNSVANTAHYIINVTVGQDFRVMAGPFYPPSGTAEMTATIRTMRAAHPQENIACVAGSDLDGARALHAIDNRTASSDLAAIEASAEDERARREDAYA